MDLLAASQPSISLFVPPHTKKPSPVNWRMCCGCVPTLPLEQPPQFPHLTRNGCLHFATRRFACRFVCSFQSHSPARRPSAASQLICKHNGATFSRLASVSPDEQFIRVLTAPFSHPSIHPIPQSRKQRCAAR